MAINIGRTGTSGRFIGGGAGVYRHTGLKLLIDPYKYECFSPQPTDSGMSDLSGWGNDIYPRNGATNFSNGYWYFDGTDDFAYRFDDSDFDFGTSTDFSILKKPQLFYLPDFKRYNDYKGFVESYKKNLIGFEIKTYNSFIKYIEMCMDNKKLYLKKLLLLVVQVLLAQI